MISLKKQAVLGIKWTFIAGIAQRIISLGATAILARVLAPADFGLFGLAFVMIEALGLFKAFGFDSALVRRKDDIDKACNTAFFLIPPIGIILYIILFILAPMGAKFMGNHSLTNVVRALGFVFIVGCLGKVAQNVLYRDMKFKYKSIGEIVSALLYCSTAVILALNKFGIWSLVIAYILKTISQISLDWYFSGWKPKFEFDKEIAWDMFHFGKYIIGSSIVYYLYSNLDAIVIGKMLGVTMLGYYVIAKNTSNFLNSYFLEKVGYVMYPAYSKIQNSQEAVTAYLLKILKYISIIVFPFAIGFSLFAPEIIHLVFGEKWLPATNILRILAFAGIFNSLGTAIWPIFLARGKSKADFQVNAVQVSIFFVLVIPLIAKLKLVGVGLAVLISSIVSLCIALIRVRQLIQVTFMEIFESIRLALVCSILMLIITFASKQVSFTVNIGYSFFLLSILSILIYSSSVYFIERKVFKDILGSLFNIKSL